MKESITINLKKTMPLGTRISEASRQIRDWLEFLDVELDSERHKLKLANCELDNNEFRYHYSLTSHKELSASAAGVRKKRYNSDTCLYFGIYGK